MSPRVIRLLHASLNCLRGAAPLVPLRGRVGRALFELTLSMPIILLRTRRENHRRDRGARRWRDPRRQTTAGTKGDGQQKGPKWTDNIVERKREQSSQSRLNGISPVTSSTNSSLLSLPFVFIEFSPSSFVFSFRFCLSCSSSKFILFLCLFQPYHHIIRSATVCLWTWAANIAIDMIRRHRLMDRKHGHWHAMTLIH